jgi:hypothetical protein
MSYRTSHRLGISLFECMVVICVLVILVSLLLVGLRSSQESAKSTACLYNLRGLGFATATYSQTNKDLLPLAFEPADAQIGQIAPFDILAQELGIDPPRMAQGKVQSSPAFICPSDRLRADRFGTNYRYVPADFMRINVWSGNPQLGVSRMYALSTEDLPLFADVDMVHGPSNRRESRQSVTFSQTARRDPAGSP